MKNSAQGNFFQVKSVLCCESATWTKIVAPFRDDQKISFQLVFLINSLTGNLFYGKNLGFCE